MKRMIAIVISAITALNCFAATYTSGNFTYSYTVGRGEASLDRYSGSDSSVNIPSSISVKIGTDSDGHDKFETFYVTKISPGAFKNNKTITSVSWSSRLKVVDGNWAVEGAQRGGAFEGCSNLADIPSLSGLTTIGNSAFYGCAGLKSVEIPSTVTSLGMSAFEGCTGIRTAVVNGVGVKLCSGLFGGCTNLESVVLGDEVVGIDVEFRGYVTYAPLPLSNCKNLKTVTLGRSITAIPANFVSGLPLVERVESSGSIASIGDNAFNGCANLVEIPSLAEATTIGQKAFYNCGKLSVCLDIQKCEKIGSEAFGNCRNISDVKFGGQLTEIDGSAFYGCVSIQSIELPNSVKSFGWEVFGGCTGLKTAFVDGAGIKVSSGFFSGCTSLENIVLGDGIVGMEGEFRGYVTYAPRPLSGCNSLKTIALGRGMTVIPESFISGLSQMERVTSSGIITKVEDNAFSGCSNIIEIPSLLAVTNIGQKAFYNCSKLSSVKLNAKLGTLSSLAFGNCASLSDVVFNGQVPNVGGASGSRVVFYNCPATARGHYPASYAADWKAVIDPSTKKWQGLVMEEVPSPQLVIDSVSWSDFTLSLSWGKTTTGVDVTGPCSLYRGTSEDISQATCILKDSLATTYTDSSFLDVSPKIKPLYYWVVPAGGDLSMASAPIKTRNRRGLFVGYDDYKWDIGFDYSWFVRAPKGGSASLNESKSFYRHLNEYGGFNEDSEFLPNAKTSEIVSSFDSIARKTQKGDLFLFYISTHGGYSNRKARLVTYDSLISAEDLQTCLMKINENGAAVVSIVMACHSESMTDAVRYLDESAMNELSSAGVARCSPGLVWVASCHDYQSSYGSFKNFTYFGLHFIEYGMIEGFSDELGRGPDDCKNSNLEIDLFELSQYTDRMYFGRNDDFHSSITWDRNYDSLMSSIIVCEKNYINRIEVPKTISKVECFNYRTWGVEIEWSKADGAEYYRVYRQEGDDISTRKCICNVCGGTCFTDENVGLAKTYRYSVVPVNASGMGPESGYAEGHGLFALSDATIWTDSQKEGVSVFQSSRIGANEASKMEFKLELSGVLSFDWQTSCESALELPSGGVTFRDHAEFLVDGEVVATSDGESTWKQVSVNLSGGKSHTVTWRYVKDGSGSAGEDCVWVSDIQFAAIADEETSGDLLDESAYNWFYETTPAAFTESEPFEYNPVLTPENATCQIDICAAIGEVESSALLEEDVEDAQTAIVKVAGAFGLDYAVLTADGWTMVGNGGLGAEGNDGNKISVVIDYAAKPSKVKYMISGHTLTNADGVALFECAAQKSSVQALVAKGDGTIDCWAGKYEVVNSDVQFVEEGSEIELAANLDAFPSETFQVSGGGTLVIPSDKIPVGGVNRKLHVDGNSKVRFDLSGSGTIPSMTRLFNGVGGAFVIGDNIQLVVPGEGVERVSKLFVKDGNLEARVAERPVFDEDSSSDSAFTVNVEGDSTAVSASIGNAVEGFWYGLLTTGMLMSDFVLDPDSIKQCTGTGSLRLESSANANSGSGFYRVSVSAEKP